MTDTKDILKRIAALRVRLDHAQPAAPDDRSLNDEPQVVSALAALQEKVRTGSKNSKVLDDNLRQISGVGSGVAPMPPKLTARGGRVLQRGRDLLHQLRDMIEDPLLQGNDQDALADLHAEIASMLDVMLRTVQAFPPAASAQIRLCEGLEAAQRLIEQRLMVLHGALTFRRREMNRLEILADVFRKLSSGHNANLQFIQTIAEEIAEEVKKNEPLRFLYASADDPARFAAAHGITTAQVMGRLLRDDADWNDRLGQALFAALVHDIGMARVPADILATPGPLSDEQRRLVERHPSAGAHILSRVLPGGGIFIEAAAHHHERLDGTGYPEGRRDSQLPSFVRILAICDVYAALAAHRPHRTAHETRIALTDTLLMADQGLLDRTHAEKLLELSFYPVGSVVELSDGAAGYVFATQSGRAGIDHPAQPIVSLLTGPAGQALVFPHIVDLAQDGRTIVRGLPRAERRKLLLDKHPELI
jgi:HD-GYP domain-containing protein (c-di-GMP phosphodiesterase class II)